MKPEHLNRIQRAGVIAMLLLLVACGGHEFWATPIAAISVSPPAPSLLTGAQQQFTANATYQNGGTKVLAVPVWTTSNAAIVFINSSGMATAVAIGSATISASSEGISGSTTVSITTSPLNSIEITPQNPSVRFSQGTQQFSATAVFSDGTIRDISSGVTWTSSNSAAATIGKTGLATLAGSGTTTIKATSGNVSDSTTLTVIP
jgi:hypothetical protein